MSSGEIHAAPFRRTALSARKRLATLVIAPADAFGARRLSLREAVRRLPSTATAGRRSREPVTAPLSRNGSVAGSVAVVAVVVLVPALLLRGWMPHATASTWLSVLMISNAFVWLLAGFGLGVRYQALGEARVGWLAVAVLATGLTHVVVPLLQIAIRGSFPAAEIGSPARAVLLVPWVWYAARSLRATGVDRRLYPCTAGILLGMLVVAVAAVIIFHGGPAGLPARLSAGVDGAAALGCVLLVVATLRSSELRPKVRLCTSALLALGAGSLGSVAAAGAFQVSAPLYLAAGALVGATVLIALITLTLLWEVQEVNQRRLEDYLHRAEQAETLNRRTEERIHQVRTSVRALSTASEVLSPPRRPEDPQAPALGEMLVAETSRLSRLLGDASALQIRSPRVVALDDVIRPVLSIEGALGAHVRWVEAGTRALCDPDATAEILRILLSNAARHAPGATVRVRTWHARESAWLEVSDDGPGIDPRLVVGIFRRGVHAPGSGGQGVGLHLAHELALEQGGSLALMPPAPGTGAWFVLRLPGPRSASTTETPHGWTLSS